MLTFPVTPLEFNDLIRQGFDDGIIGFGLVQRIAQGDATHFAILDGGWWSHPGLEPFLGKRIGLNLNFAERQLEVTAWPDYDQKLAVLDGADYRTIWQWLSYNPEAVRELRRQITARAVSLDNALFHGIPSQTVVVHGLVQFTFGVYNGLGMDAELIQLGNTTFFSRDMPELLASYVGQVVTVIVEAGRLVVIPPAAAEA